MTEQIFARSRRAGEEAILYLAAPMSGLSEADWAALDELPVRRTFIARGKTLIREGEPVEHLSVLCQGWAMRCRRLDDERRQILDFALPGDVLGLHRDGGGASTSDVEAMTPCEVGEIERGALERLAERVPAIAFGMTRHLTRELALASDHVVRLGRMTAYERVCNFLLDIYARQHEIAPVSRSVDFPITQTVVADALGLSVVHVNRQVMRLRREGLVTLNRRQLTVHHPMRLAELSGYRDRRFSVSREINLATD